jgi:hypothetical protein
MKAPLVMVLGLLPAAAYETYRAWGPLTKFAAWLFLAVLAVEVILVFKKINIDLVRLSGPASGRIAGYNLPLTDIKVAGLLLLAVLSLILVIRTVGPYTKWLAADIVAGCLYAVYLLSPKHFGALIHWASHGVSNFVHHLMH